MAAAVVLVVVATRLAAPLFLSRFPLPAILVCLVVDAVDQSVLDVAGVDLAGYQTYDKALDTYYLALAYLSTIRNWGGGPDFAVGRALWYVRLVGVTLFEWTGARWVLLVFANTFEYFFIALEGYKVRRDPNRLSASAVVTIAAAIWVVVKLPQEWWIHVAQLDVTDVLKEHVYGAAPGEGWGDVLRDRPEVTLGLLVVALAGVWVARRVAERWLPPADWLTALDADRQGAELGWRPPPRRVRPSARFDWTFVEKVVLVGLVAFVFARMLPGAEARLSVTLLVTAYLVAMTTLLSRWLAARGMTWANTAVEFAAMGTANVAVVLATAALVGPGPGATPLGTALFLVGLLTLIVVVYDRSLAAYERRRPPADAPAAGGGAGA